MYEILLIEETKTTKGIVEDVKIIGNGDPLLSAIRYQAHIEPNEALKQFWFECPSYYTSNATHIVLQDKYGCDVYEVSPTLEPEFIHVEKVDDVGAYITQFYDVDVWYKDEDEDDYDEFFRELKQRHDHAIYVDEMKRRVSMELAKKQREREQKESKNVSENLTAVTVEKNGMIIKFSLPHSELKEWLGL